MDRLTALERAFQPAASGTFNSVEKIKASLKQEGFDVAQITGRTLAGQLREKIKRAAEGNVG